MPTDDYAPVSTPIAVVDLKYGKIFFNDRWWEAGLPDIPTVEVWYGQCFDCGAYHRIWRGPADMIERAKQAIEIGEIELS